MTHHTDAERAEPIKMQAGDDLHLTMLMASHGLNFVTGKDREQLLAWGRDVWQAARRAPAAPVPQEPTSKQVVLGAGALLGQPENTADNRHPDWHSAVAKARSVYLAMLAAAPQPPEAAPVELPEPDAWMATPVMQSGRGATTVFCSDKRMADQWDYGGHPEYGRMLVTGLFTEQQVREMLAAHGIGKDKA